MLPFRNLKSQKLFDIIFNWSIKIYVKNKMKGGQILWDYWMVK